MGEEEKEEGREGRRKRSKPGCNYVLRNWLPDFLTFLPPSLPLFPSYFSSVSAFLFQAPDKVKVTDRSSTLFSSSSSSSYFASYNVPSDREIYDYLGFGLKVR